MRKVIEAVLESAKDSTPVYKYAPDLTIDSKNKFYYLGKSIKNELDVELVLRYLDFNGVVKNWKLSKELKTKLFNDIWKCIPNGYHITFFIGRGFTVKAVKKGKNIEYTDSYGKVSRFDGAWYLMGEVKEGNPIIISKNEPPNGIQYTDISNSFGKKHDFDLDSSGISGGKKIGFDDDFVIVYKNEKQIYKGLEDYEPMKRENWKWDSSKKYYVFGDYIKVCIDN